MKSNESEPASKEETGNVTSGSERRGGGLGPWLRDNSTRRGSLNAISYMTDDDQDEAATGKSQLRQRIRRMESYYRSANFTYLHFQRRYE